MFKNYLKLAIRDLRRNRLQTGINVLGLSVGMIVFILILQYVSMEKRFDNFHPGAANLYRLGHEANPNSGTGKRVARSMAAEGPRLKELFPAVKEFVRIHSTTALITHENVSFNEEGVFFVDEAFFRVFGFPLTRGSADKALAEPGNIVISGAAARKYFGSASPMGKLLTVNDGTPYKVTGVVDVPENTHLKFDFLLPAANLMKPTGKYVKGREWRALDFYTYLQLAPGTDYQAFQKKLLPFWKQNCTSDCEDVKNLFLQPVTDIHLYSNLQYELGVNGNGKMINLMLTLAFVILIVAWINYINLSTSNTTKRIKEVGVRLTFGAKQTQLGIQFTFEAVLLNVCTAILSITAAFLSGGLLQKYLGVRLSPAVWGEAWFWLIILGIFCLGGLLSGIPSAVILSSLKPIEALKPKRVNSKGMVVNLRANLSVIQFACSIALIIGTFVIYHQVDYIKKQNIGINLDQTLIVKVAPVLQEKGNTLSSFKADVLGHTTVAGITGSSLIPGKDFNMESGAVKKVGTDQEYSSKVMIADINFPGVYGLKVLDGQEFFTGNNRELRAAFVVNEAAAKLLNIKNIADNEKLTVSKNELEVKAITANFYQKTTKSSVEPLILMVLPIADVPVFYYSIKVNTTNMSSTVDFIEKSWKKNFGGVPFEFFFLDDLYNQQYQSDEQFMKLFMVFAFLSILVSSLGIFGLSVFNATRRTKEIGVRKVLGASAMQVLFLLLYDVVKLVLIANLIAWPLAYLYSSFWLEEFATKVPVQWWWFFVSGIAVLIIALLVVSFFTVKAAVTNPVKSLKDE